MMTRAGADEFQDHVQQSSQPRALVILAFALLSATWLGRFACSRAPVIVALAGVLSLALAALRLTFLAQGNRRRGSRAFAVGLTLVSANWLMTVVLQRETIRPRTPLEVIPDRGSSREIPDGRVELAGVAVDWYGAMSPNWWHADGSPVRVRDWAMDPRYVPTVVAQRQQRMFAIKACGDRRRPSILNVQFDGSPDYYRGFQIQSMDGELSAWRGMARIFPRDQTETTIRVLVASGSFVPVSVRWDRTASTLVSRDGTTPWTAAVQGDREHVRLTIVGEALDSGPLTEYRIRARLRDGQWRDAIPVPLPTGTSAATGEWRFPGQTLEQIEEFSVEARSASWVEFRNVALSTHPADSTARPQ